MEDCSACSRNLKHPDNDRVRSYVDERHLDNAQRFFCDPECEVPLKQLWADLEER